jgi:UDP-glucose 4-epimerase
MKILVTGGNGFIGSNLIKVLASKGHEIVSIDDLSNGSQNNEIREAVYIHDDIEKVGYFDGTDVDVVFHLAALSRIQPSFKYPSEFFRVNVKGTEIVADWATQYGVKMIYAGSSSVHNDPLNSPYATYKGIAENIVQMHAKSLGLDAHIARFYNVYGPLEIEDGEFASLIGKWLGNTKRKEKISVVGTGEQTRDFTHVDDIVDGLIKIMEYGKVDNNVWELGTGTPYSVNEVAEMFKTKFKCEVEYVDNQPGNYKQSYRVNDKAIELLDWEPTKNLQDYINGL